MNIFCTLMNNKGNYSTHTHTTSSFHLQMIKVTMRNIMVYKSNRLKRKVEMK